MEDAMMIHSVAEGIRDVLFGRAHYFDIFEVLACISVSLSTMGILSAYIKERALWISD
jgi:hypothetical protein